MYVDESGDSGPQNSPSRYFVLTGIVIHELRWQLYLDQLINFRRRMQQQFGLKLREEIHASAFISRPGPLVRIKRNDRLTILRMFADELATMTDLNVINIVVDKERKPATYDVFALAWKALIQRFENTLAHKNFVGPANSDDRGILLPDNTDDKKLSQLLRQLRRYNPIPNQSIYGAGYRNLILRNMIEDPIFKDSAHSHFIQAADLVAFLLYQQSSPNTYMRKKSGQNYFARLSPILCKVAAPKDPQGIVRL